MTIPKLNFKKMNRAQTHEGLIWKILMYIVKLSKHSNKKISVPREWWEGEIQVMYGWVTRLFLEICHTWNVAPWLYLFHESRQVILIFRRISKYVSTGGCSSGSPDLYFVSGGGDYGHLRLGGHFLSKRLLNRLKPKLFCMNKFF